MTIWACAVRLDGGPAPAPASARVLGHYAGDRGLVHHAASGLRAVVGARGDEAVSPAVVRAGDAVGVGVARLDDRGALHRQPGVGGPDAAGDLDLVVRHLAAGLPPECIPGDFAVVVWNGRLRRLVAARDALGVRRLYWAAPRPGVLQFASHAGLLAAADDAYDVEQLAAWIAACEPEPGRTVYAGVHALPGGSALGLSGGAPAVEAFWSPRAVQESGEAGGSEGEQCAAFRALLIDGVRARLDDRAWGTWAHLSGGLDSSSVVSVAQWLAERGAAAHGLAGTVSYVDDRGTAADERAFSDAVVRRYRVPNVAVAHQAGWRDVLHDPPRFDQPSDRSYFVAARDREVARVVRGAGGRVLLTGIGGDHLTLGTMFFFADWVARGEVRRAGREMLRRAALGRVSFWRLAYENALLPLLTPRVRRALLGAEGRGGVPPWVAPALARRVAHAARATEDSAYGGRRGRKYADALAAGVAAIPSQLAGGAVEDALDVRHPFLHRPLVELALRLPPELCVRPHARKWVLREATRGVLPEAVRTRVGKGSGNGLMAWSLTHERAWVEELLRDPILAELGCVDPVRLRSAVARVGARARGDPDDDPALLAVRALEVEMWLRVRAGRWAATVSRAGGTTGNTSSEGSRTAHATGA